MAESPLKNISDTCLSCLLLQRQMLFGVTHPLGVINPLSLFRFPFVAISIGFSVKKQVNHT